MAKTLEEIDESVGRIVKGSYRVRNGATYTSELTPMGNALKDLIDYLKEKDKYPEGKIG